jgi:pilus assembly protein CpaE
MLAKVLPKSKNSEPLEFSAFITDDETCAAVARAANDIGLGEVPIIQGAIADAVKQLAKASTPRLLLVDLTGSADPLSDLAALAEVCDEGTQVVTIGDVNDIGLYRQLVGVGVNDYLVKPLSPEALGPALTRVEEKPQDDPQGAGMGATMGKLISVIGARGGVGATSVAVNTAWSIAHEHRKRVALVDLDIFFGNCGLTLDLESGRGFREALENPSRIDGLFIERAMVRESDNLYVLTAEESLEKSLSFNTSAVELLLDHLRRDFQYVILDLPRFGARTQLSVLAPPSSVILVSDPSLSGMRDTLRLANLFKQSGNKTDLSVTLNRVGANKTAELSKADFERGAEVKVSHSIPFDSKVFAECVSTGKPLLKAGPRSKAAAAVREICLGQCGAAAKDTKKLPFWKSLGKGKK